MKLHETTDDQPHLENKPPQAHLLLHFLAIFTLLTSGQLRSEPKINNTTFNQLRRYISIGSFVVIVATALYLFFAGIYFLISWENPLFSMTTDQLDNAAKSIRNPKAIIVIFLFRIWPILLIAYSSAVLLFSKMIIEEYRKLNSSKET